MVNHLKRKFGEPNSTVIAIGDWDQKIQMKGKEPTKGKGFRKTLRQAGYRVYLVDEFRTSCVCYKCGERLEKFLYRECHKPKRLGERELVHGLLGCKTINGCGRLWNRDVNGSLNILMLAEKALGGEERPEKFRRGNENSGSDRGRKPSKKSLGKAEGK